MAGGDDGYRHIRLGPTRDDRGKHIPQYDTRNIIIRYGSVYMMNSLGSTLSGVQVTSNNFIISLSILKAKLFHQKKIQSKVLVFFYLPHWLAHKNQDPINMVQS